MQGMSERCTSHDETLNRFCDVISKYATESEHPPTMVEAVTGAILAEIRVNAIGDRRKRFILAVVTARVVTNDWSRV